MMPGQGRSKTWKHITLELWMLHYDWRLSLLVACTTGHFIPRTSRKMRHIKPATINPWTRPRAFLFPTLLKPRPSFMDWKMRFLRDTSGFAVANSHGYLGMCRAWDSSVSHTSCLVPVTGRCTVVGPLYVYPALFATVACHMSKHACDQSSCPGYLSSYSVSIGFLGNFTGHSTWCK